MALPTEEEPQDAGPQCLPPDDTLSREERGEFPAHEFLEEPLEAARVQLKWDLEQIDAAEDVAKGWRFDMLWGDRLNLRSEDHHLLQEAADIAPPASSGQYLATWRNYLRNLVRPGFFYFFETKRSIVFYVSENKTLAGREGRGEDEAVGRPLVVTFFEKVPDTESLFRRVDRTGDLMRPTLLTVAELLNTCGVWLPNDPERSSKDTEALLEDLFLAQGPRRMRGTLETEAPGILCYTLTDEVDAEEAYLTETLAQDLTKVALARCLEIHLEEPRRQNFNLSWAALWERAKAFLPEPLAPPAPRRGRGRGGKGNAKGGAKGGRRGGRA